MSGMSLKPLRSGLGRRGSPRTPRGVRFVSGMGAALAAAIAAATLWGPAEISLPGQISVDRAAGANRGPTAPPARSGTVNLASILPAPPRTLYPGDPAPVGPSPTNSSTPRKQLALVPTRGIAAETTQVPGSGQAYTSKGSSSWDSSPTTAAPVPGSVAQGGTHTTIVAPQYPVVVARGGPTNDGESDDNTKPGAATTTVPGSDN